VVHGFFAHMILAGMAAAAVMLSMERHKPDSACCDNLNGPGFPDALCDTSVAQSDYYSSTFRVLAACLVSFVFLQTLLGTLVRQLDVFFLAHVSLAALVVLTALATGMHAWGVCTKITLLSRSGVALMFLVLLQIMLGIVSVVCRTPTVGQSPPAEVLAAQTGRLPVGPLPALITTAHQTTAALILVAAIIVAVCTWRPASSR
jgi:heme A synthase